MIERSRVRGSRFVAGQFSGSLDSRGVLSSGGSSLVEHLLASGSRPAASGSSPAARTGQKSHQRTESAPGELTSVELGCRVEVVPDPAVDLAGRFDESDQLPAADRQTGRTQIPPERQQIRPSSARP